MNNISRSTSRRFVEALRQVEFGADVYDYGLAKTLRNVEKHAPECITIVPAMENPPGHMRQPYFGAIVTADGRRWIRRETEEAAK